MGSKSIASWAIDSDRGHEGERDNNYCFSKIQLAEKNIKIQKY